MDGNFEKTFEEIYYNALNRFTDFKTPDNSKLNSNDISRICEYLENPTKSGFWILELVWNSEADFFKSIKEQLELPHVDAENLENILNLGSSINSQLSRTLTSQKEEKDINETINTLTFIFRIFQNLTFIELGKEYPFLSKYSRDYGIHSKIDIKKIKEKYSEAYDYFKNEINFDLFYPIIYANTVFRSKDGFIISTKFSNHSINEGNELTRYYISFDPTPLEKLQEFLSKICVEKFSKLQLVFSPEEKILEPYFTIFKVSHSYLIKDTKILNLFVKSFQSYNDKNYEYCISNLGIIAEDYLTQVYETFFRQPIPKKSSMGQTYDLINNSVSKQFQTQPKSPPNINLFYERIQKLLDVDPSQVTTDVRNEEILKLLRDILYFIQEDKKSVLYLIDSIEKSDSKVSVFPKELRDNINELLKYRNSISHNSKILIGQYEAQRALFCGVTLLRWWMKEIDTIEWKEDQLTILKKAIERSK